MSIQMIPLRVSLLLAVVLASVSSASATAYPFGLGQSVVFGVPRGGGLFGGNKGDKKSTTVGTSAGNVADVSGDKTMYPAMTQQEIEDWMEHIPVFAVTDQNGAGVVLKPENDSSVFYFFLNPLQANATLAQLQQGESLPTGADGKVAELKVSAFSLGKIWFDLLSQEGSDSAAVQYRLVPDTRDLLGARMLLTMSPEDGEKLKESGSMTAEMAQAAIQKAMTESPKFKESFNEIPVFTIAQMRMQKQPEEGSDSGEEPVTLLPMYFSLQNMVSTWQQFMSAAPPEVQGTEPAINLMSLHDLVAMMQNESEIDFRNVVLVPTSNPQNAGPAGATVTAATADPMSQMGGATLGDDE